MKAIILASTHQKEQNSQGIIVPVPLLDLDNKPMLTVLVERLFAISSLSEIYIVTNNAIKSQLDTWSQEIAGSIPVRIISDGTNAYEDRRGATGDIVYIIEKENILEDILVVGGSNWFTFDLNEFVNQAQGKSPAVIISSISSKGTNLSRFGLVRIDNDSRILEFAEKPTTYQFDLKASCIYYFSANDIKWFSEFKKEHSLVCTPGDYLAWLIKNKNLPCYGIKMAGVWYDVIRSHQLTLAGPDFLPIRKVMREIIDMSHSTWERCAAKQLSLISAYSDLLDILKDKDINRKIIALYVLGNIGHLLNEEGKNIVIQHLCSCLCDSNVNDYTYSFHECDEDEPPVYVYAVAAKSLVMLGYEQSESAVYHKARQEGYVVAE